MLPSDHARRGQSASAGEGSGRHCGQGSPGGDAPTVAEAWEEVIRLRRPTWCDRGKSEAQWRASFRDYVEPALGSKRVTEVTTADVLAVLVPHWHERAETMRRVKQRLGAVLGWALAQGLWFAGHIDSALRGQPKSHSDADPETRFKVQTHRVSWVDELLCDSLATAICGPGYLFAAASFLPATAHDDPASSHPFPSDRLRFSLASLDSSGWSDFMAATCPETVGWLRQRATPRTPTSGQERFLREACEALAPAIESTVANHVSEAAIDPDGYAAVAPPALDQLRMRVPASEIDQEPIGPWHILVLGWQWSFEVRGDSPATLAQAPNDPELSRVLLRAIEMAQIRRLWSDDDVV